MSTGLTWCGIRKKGVTISNLQRPEAKETDLKKHQIQNILDNLSDATMIRIAEAGKKGEEITVMDLREFTTELQDTAAQHLRNSGVSTETADHVIQAGRARIVIDGALTTTQKRLLKDIAKMIRTALDT